MCLVTTSLNITMSLKRSDYFLSFFYIVFCEENNTYTLNSVDVFGLMVSLRYLLTACGTIFQEKQPNFAKIRQCHMNQSVFRVCLVAQFFKILLQTPNQPEEGKRVKSQKSVFMC